MKKFLFICLVVLFAACSGTARMRTPAGPASVGDCKATTVSGMIFGFIPVMYNDRLQRAYDECAGTFGARSLSNIEVQEKWYFALLGNVFVTTVSGSAAR